MDKKYLSRDKIVGKQVIDSNALIVGTVKDIVLDVGSKNIAFSVVTKTGTDITIDGKSITAVGEVILLSKRIEIPGSPQVETVPVHEKSEATSQPPPAIGLCNSCGYQNDVNSKFCIKCGQRLVH
ncbi:MAG: zinc-ribbon domain-containing protein [Candidatus Bathyarchaeota archaeon]